MSLIALSLQFLAGAAWVGQPNLAVGDVLGSCVFGLLLLVVVDAWQRRQPMDAAAPLRGPLLADVSIAHAGTAVTAMTMTGLVLIGLVLRPQGRVVRFISWISIGLVAAYAVNAALLTLGGA